LDAVLGGILASMLTRAVKGAAAACSLVRRTCRQASMRRLHHRDRVVVRF
jgi:hypothetical protein